MTTIGEFATAAGRRPDWWLQAAADEMRRSHNAIRAGVDPATVLPWLQVRIEQLIYLAEHSTSGDTSCVGG